MHVIPFPYYSDTLITKKCKLKSENALYGKKILSKLISKNNKSITSGDRS